MQSYECIEMYKKNLQTNTSRKYHLTSNSKSINSHGMENDIQLYSESFSIDLSHTLLFSAIKHTPKGSSIKQKSIHTPI